MATGRFESKIGLSSVTSFHNYIIETSIRQCDFHRDTLTTAFTEPINYVRFTKIVFDPKYKAQIEFTRNGDTNFHRFGTPAHMNSQLFVLLKKKSRQRSNTGRLFNNILRQNIIFARARAELLNNSKKWLTLYWCLGLYH